VSPGSSQFEEATPVVGKAAPQSEGPATPLPSSGATWRAPNWTDPRVAEVAGGELESALAPPRPTTFVLSSLVQAPSKLFGEFFGNLNFGFVFSN